jgi:acyl transferase domain-containing protein/NAD(P)H-dependent flavin oxidoreductase YrpB (nitropropane dioxygenase family)/NAD(P)-dependent dehydrogenase (short-subunit alcohol dehydrogenase family)
LRVLVADPFGRPSPRVVIAAARAGALGVLDIDDRSAASAIAEVTSRTELPFAVRTDGSRVRDPELVLPPQVETVVLAPGAPPALTLRGRRVLATVRSTAEADAAARAGVDGLIAKGAESGGAVGDTDAFVLLQQLLATHPDLPVWVQGGIGLYTAAAAIAAGATGIVLDSQLALLREVDLDDPLRRAIAAMDGSETKVVAGYRLYTRPDLEVATLQPDIPAEEIETRLGTDLDRDLVPIGQEAATASVLAARFATVGGVVTAINEHIDRQLESARATQPLAPGAGVATTNGTRYPVVQGPMTRVSDRAAFAEAVAEAGGLPFLALALLRANEVKPLLEETAARLGDRSWGVGILGFVPPELREEQLEVVRAVRPPMALIAGGRPGQAAPLEAEGIRTYIHAPSPGLIETFVKAGARRFVFEGRACGGHVGPRSSFVLWEAAVERLAALDCVDELDLLFAGGVHDARSAAAVAALATPLTNRGARIGVLMGTAYLFTEEAVAAGAITPAFQQEALACERTALLETAPGHVTRCATSPYVQTFEDARAQLVASGASQQEVWGELESLNLGRLRIASKGITREGDSLREVDEDELRNEGMFMIGDVATMRDEITTIAELHDSVSAGASVFLTGDDAAPRVAAVDRCPPRLDIAIVGMAALMPGASETEQFWANVVAGVDAITEVPETRWDPGRYFDAAATTVGAGRKTPSKWGGFLPPVGFDALAYGIPPRSLASIDPAQLLALEVAARALRDAGYEKREFDRSRASVIFGAEGGADLALAYGFRAALPSFLPHGNGHGPLPPDLDEHLPEMTEDSFPGVLTNVIAGRIANRLDLGGVNYTVDAACAASLAALDLACKELVSGISDLVLCGGVDLHNGIYDYLLFASVHALSASGRCRTFDASADGIALGEGVACVALKRLRDAERDGDRVYAVIEAVGGSSDGRALGLTAPRTDGQRRALERAYAQAGRSPREIGLVEAHGTGTVVGDATELAALTELFTEHGAQPGSCVLGSVKSQVGHTKCTAGLAGVIKTARALYHGVLPPTLHLDQPNPRYDEGQSPFRFVRAAQPWLAPERRAGVSAFGFGGTNFHALLSSYAGDPEPRHGALQWPAELVMVRAQDAASARARLAALADVVTRIVADDPRCERHALRDVARAICDDGERPVQVAVVADDVPHLGRLLERALDGSATASDGVFVVGDDDLVREDGPRLAFMFPGQGSQRVGMLGDLFVAFPALRTYLAADVATAAHIFPPAAFDVATRDTQRAALTDTRVAQPALGLVERALVELLERVGVQPSAAAGHSYGELVALATAGAFGDEALASLSHLRGRVVAEAAADANDPGAMAAVNRSTTELRDLLADHPEVVIANQNSPRQSVLSGPTPAIEAAMAALADAGISAKRLPVACAFHSPIVAPARAALAEALESTPPAPLDLPVWSNMSAAPYPSDPRSMAGVLAEQVAHPVRFADQIESMYEAGYRVFVEVGPGRVLTGLVRETLGDRPHRAIACDAPNENGIRRLLLALAELATIGVAVDTNELFAGRAHSVELGELPRPAPAWTVDGHLVRTADGLPVAGGLRPANENPVIGLGAAMPSVPTNGAAAAADVVSEYLHNLRETVAAERDVMLQFLGAAQVDRPLVIDARVSAAALTEPGTAVRPLEPGEPAAEVELPTGDELLARIVDIVSEQTGYPRDMLDPDLDLESDLSIDSIKRIEIIGELAEKIGLPGTDAGLDDDAVEELAQIKTLRGVVEWIDEAATRSDGADSGSAVDAPRDAAIEIPARAVRAVVEEVPAEPGSVAALAAGSRALLVDDGSGVVPILAEQLRGDGVDVATVDVGGDVGTATRGADAVIVIDLADRGAPAVFDALAPAALADTQWLGCVTAADAVGGQCGLIRALHAEFPARTTRSLAVPRGLDPATVADWAREELSRPGPVDVWRNNGVRHTRRVAPTERLAGGEAARILDPDAVVLLTGGARGITARCAIAMAQAGAAHLHLVGRSPLPDGEEPPELAAAGDARALRQALLARCESRTPVEIESEVQRLVAERETRATLRAAAEAGAQVRYHRVDVRDRDALTAVVESCVTEHGRLDGVVHGAGVIEDRHVRDKTAESFRRVFETKVTGARTLLETVIKVAPGVGFVVLFGSVSGVYGNKGQVDYAAANDALDALAAGAPDALSGRVIAVDWGPWGESGMVSDDLARAYARRGIGVIDPDDGVAALLEELAYRYEHGAFPATQVLFARADPSAFSLVHDDERVST